MKQLCLQQETVNAKLMAMVDRLAASEADAEDDGAEAEEEVPSAE